MDVHEVVDNPALNVVLNPIDQESTAHVKDLYVGEFPDQSPSDEEGKFQKYFTFHSPYFSHKRASWIHYLSFSSSIGMYVDL